MINLTDNISRIFFAIKQDAVNVSHFNRAGNNEMNMRNLEWLPVVLGDSIKKLVLFDASVFVDYQKE